MLRLSLATVKDRLTWLSRQIDGGLVVIVERWRQPVALLRSFEPNDTGRQIALTQLHRQLHRIVADLRGEPVIVTMYGEPCIWLGPVPDDFDERFQGWREVPLRVADRW